jgi:2-polyprenyl-3-methyl-5-hydroxy-6-metoxy-1,4-benzoquinol methylase
MEQMDMTIRSDPEGKEIGALLDFVDLSGKQVLEIGSGQGRLTRRFAGMTAGVTAVEPSAESINKARQDLSPELSETVHFEQVNFEEFAIHCQPGRHDIAILSWSL